MSVLALRIVVLVV